MATDTSADSDQATVALEVAAELSAEIRTMREATIPELMRRRRNALNVAAAGRGNTYERMARVCGLSVPMVARELSEARKG